MKYLIAIFVSILALSACHGPSTVQNPVVVLEPDYTPKPLAAPEQENTPGEEAIVIDPFILPDLPPPTIGIFPDPSISPPPAASNFSEPELIIAPVGPALTPAPKPDPVLKSVEAHMSVETTDVTIEAPKPVKVDTHMSVETTLVTTEAPKPVIVDAHMSVETTTVTLEAPKPVIVDAHMSLETTTVTLEAPKPVIVEAHKSVETTTVTLEAPKPVIVEAHKSVETTDVTVEAPKPIIVEVFMSLETTDVTVDAPVAQNKLLFNPKDLLGKGAFGEVYRGEFNGAMVAIKKFIPNPRSGARQQKLAWELFQEEIRIMSDLHSPNIITICGVTEHDNKTCLLMECAPLGALDVLLAKAKLDGEKFSEMNQLHWCNDIANGTHYLHEKGIIHRDIKGANVLVFPAANSSNRYNLKLTDFGFALDTATNKTGARVFCGSIPWMAPERADFDNVVCTEKSDVYSVGMVFWEIVAQSTPRPGTNNPHIALQNILNGPEDRRQNIPSDTPPVLRKVIILCWKKDARARPNANEIADALSSRIQEISDEEAAALVAAAQAQQRIENPPVVEALPEPLNQVVVAQPVPKPISPLPQLGRIATAFEWLERRVENGATWMFGPPPQTPAKADAEEFEVVQTNWWGRQEKRLLRVTKTRVERINPINNDVRNRVLIRKLDRIEVSADNDVIKLIYEGPNKGQGVADTYATIDANAIVESIKRARPNIRVVILE